MSIIEDSLALLDTLVLDSGGHEPDGEFCVMEAVAYVAGEPWSDSPECVSPIIAAFLRSWNDGLPDDERQMLKPYITRVIGTKTTKAAEDKRAWMATDWLVRECAPAYLRLAGLTEYAEKLERLAALTTAKRAEKAQPTISAASKASAAARAAAGDAAGAAAGDAARAAAWDAARAAAGAAAGAAASKTKGGYHAKYAAARKAADAVFAEHDLFGDTTKALRTSALLLLDRMIEVGRKEPVLA